MAGGRDFTSFSNVTILQYGIWNQSGCAFMIRGKNDPSCFILIFSSGSLFAGTFCCCRKAPTAFPCTVLGQCIEI